MVIDSSVVVEVVKSWESFPLSIEHVDVGNITIEDETIVRKIGSELFFVPTAEIMEIEKQYTTKIGNITGTVTLTNKGKNFLDVTSLKRSPLLVSGIGMSAMVHSAFIGAFAFFMPPLGLEDDESSKNDQMYLMQQYLNASAEREQEARDDQTTPDNQDHSQKAGEVGVRAKGDEGSMGNQNSRATNKKWAVAGPSSNNDVRLAREAAVRDASQFGMIGLLNGGSQGDQNAPTVPWGDVDSLGKDTISARGNMWGDGLGEAFGAGGLGLSGIGEGGGGRGEGIGLGSIGTYGHDLVNRTGSGSGTGLIQGIHKTKVPQVRIGSTTINGRLPSEVIQRIMRQNYGRLRSCYESGLRANPGLQGRVAVRFVIVRDGSVSNVGNGGSDLPDPAVTSCIIRSVYGISFPAPENGIVSVLYPIMLSSQ